MAISVVLAGYAVWTLLDVEGAYDEMGSEAIYDDNGEPIDQRQAQREARDRLASVANGAIGPGRSRTVDELPEVEELEAPRMQLAGPVTREDAEAGFDYAMRRVEQIAGRRRRLKQEDWEELYREANDAFSAYSAHLDATDVEQAALLEDAYTRLKKGLQRVRVRGKKLAL